MSLAPGLSSELADPRRSQARNNIKELSMEKPAVRVWRRRVGTAYILFERSSRQSCSEGQGRRCLEGSAQPLSHPKCHPALYRNSFLQGEPEPSLTCPQNRDASRRAGKAVSQPAVRAPACSNTLPPGHLLHPTAPPPPRREAVLPALALSSMEPDSKVQSWQDPQQARAAKLLSPKQVGEHPQGGTK